MSSELLTVLRERGWRVRAARSPLPAEITARYPWLPPDLVAFLESLAECANDTDTAWFSTTSADTSAFRWNEWEMFSLEAAASDSAWSEQIRAFWDKHFCFLLSVKSGYSYFAVEYRQAGQHAVVYGREPEFEEVAVISASFTAWVELVTRVLSGEATSFEIEDAL